MAQEFNTYEIKQVALNLENDGFAFYMSMSNHSKTKKAKAIFLKLASDEKEHIKWINDELDVDTIIFAEETDIQLIDDYLKNLVKSGIFPNPEKAPEVMADIKKDEDGVRIGMNAETKSVQFFDQLYKNIKDSKSKDVLLKLREQEKQHYQILKEFLGEIQ